MQRMTIANAMTQLSTSEDDFVEIFQHGSLSVELYKPQVRDLQQPHERDELYVVATGAGEFIRAGQRHPIEVGEVLFVPAGVAHRFENFSEDFSVWVFFYGPEGGEEA